MLIINLLVQSAMILVLTLNYNRSAWIRMSDILVNENKS